MSLSTNPGIASAGRRWDGLFRFNPCARGYERRRRSTRITEQSRSGEGRSARLKRGARCLQIEECRIGYPARQFDGQRQWQGRWCCGHGRARQGDDGTDGAKIVRLTRIVAWRRQLLCGLYRRRRLRCDRMEVTERKRKLDGERKHCDPCAQFDVRPHPPHTDNAPRVEGRDIPAASTLQYNIASAALGCQRARSENNS